MWTDNAVKLWKGDNQCSQDQGGKRPASPVSSMIKAMRVATGIEAEEYVDAGSKSGNDSSEDDTEEYELAALEINRPKRDKKRKK